MLATTDEDNKVKLWQSDGKLILNLQGHGNRVERVDFGADGKTFAVSGVEDVRSEERFSRNAETDLVCRLLPGKRASRRPPAPRPGPAPPTPALRPRADTLP